MSKTYRCFKITINRENTPSINELDKLLYNWKRRKGDPCYVAEVFKDGDTTRIDITLWSRIGLTTEGINKIIATDMSIIPVDHVNTSRQLSSLLCEDKGKRVFATAAGF